MALPQTESRRVLAAAQPGARAGQRHQTRQPRLAIWSQRDKRQVSTQRMLAHRALANSVYQTLPSRVGSRVPQGLVTRKRDAGGDGSGILGFSPPFRRGPPGQKRDKGGRVCYPVLQIPMLFRGSSHGRPRQSRLASLSLWYRLELPQLLNTPRRAMAAGAPGRCVRSRVLVSSSCGFLKRSARL